MFPNTYNIWPSSKSLYVSLVNVEKVLNPPQTPVNRSNLYWSDKPSLMAYPATKPNNRQANALAVNVAIGKFNVNFSKSSDTVYLSILPIPPPINTYKNDIEANVELILALR